MNSRRPLILALTCFSLCAALTSSALAQLPIATVSGGGSATIEPGVVANFGVGGGVYADGSAKGSFMCMIPQIVQIHGSLESGTVNGDGSVTLTGVGSGVEFIDGKPIPFAGCEFDVTLYPGPAGVAYFIYSDCVVSNLVHSVIRGHIFIY